MMPIFQQTLNYQQSPAKSEQAEIHSALPSKRKPRKAMKPDL
jgi:hypothetical protein